MTAKNHDKNQSFGSTSLLYCPSWAWEDYNPATLNLQPSSIIDTSRKTYQKMNNT